MQSIARHLHRNKFGFSEIENENGNKLSNLIRVITEPLIFRSCLMHAKHSVVSLTSVT